MKDEAVLKKLYELEKLSGDKAKYYIAEWVDETKMSMAEESFKSIGFTDTFKAVKKIMNTNNKAKPEMAYVLKSSKKNSFVVIDVSGGCAVILKQDFGLPTTSAKKDIADQVIAVCSKYRTECTTPVNRPRPAELDFIIKDYKATPKEDRTSRYPLYHFGENMPYVDAKKLIVLSSCFPTSIAYIDKNKGAKSPIYFKYEKWEGFLMPIQR